MKALDYLYLMKKANEDMGTEPITIYEAIKELEDLQNENKSLVKTLEKYDLLDLWEDMVADLDDLSISQLCNLAEALLSKNLVLTTEFHLKDKR